MDIINIRTSPCIVCGQASMVPVMRSDFERWQGGELVQRAFPEMPPAQREVLVTGTHPECWDSIYPEEGD